MPSNIGSVINDVRETKRELQIETSDEVNQQTRITKERAKTNLLQDANWTGNTLSALSRSLEHTSRGYEGSVYVDKSQAPYAQVTEFGSGARGKAGETWGNVDVDPPEQYPAAYPFDSPDYSEQLVANILLWVETKPIPTDDPLEFAQNVVDNMDSGVGTYAHPFMRPAWQERVDEDGRGEMYTDIKRRVKDVFE